MYLAEGCVIAYYNKHIFCDQVCVGASKSETHVFRRTMCAMHNLRTHASMTGVCLNHERTCYHPLLRIHTSQGLARMF